MDKDEEAITKAYYQYTNRGWPNQKPWEDLMEGAQKLWVERAMREYRKEKNDTGVPAE